MASIHIPIRGMRSVTDSLTNAPAEAKRAIRAGMDALSVVTEDRWSFVLQTVTSTLGEARAPDPKPVAEALTVDSATAAEIMAAATLLAAIASSAGRAESPSEVVGMLATAELLNPETRSSIERFISFIQNHKRALADKVEQAQLASQVLPFLQSIEITVDWRPRAEKGRIGQGVPVVLVHIDTNHADFFFQMGRPMLERVVAELEAALKRARDIEAWAERLLKEGGS